MHHMISFASFEMNESLNLKTLINPNKESKYEIVLVHLIIKRKHESEKEVEREKKRLRSSERVHKDKKDE